MPFCDPFERDLHFEKHGHKFRAKDADEYERMAETFISEMSTPDTRDCFRPDGVHRLRFDVGTRYFGVARTHPIPECLRTFHPVGLSKINRHGGRESYFRWECARIFR
jgi:hypothetical protein